jgi:diguanylate cyclase (GGDEF)-like protein/PAS domain S-box-containing protein
MADMSEQAPSVVLPVTLEGSQAKNIELYLSVIFNNLGDPIFVKNDECKLVLVNDAFCEMFGLPRSEIIGKTLAEKVSPSEQDHFLAVDRRVLQEGIEILCEETLTTQGQETRTILTRKNRFIDGAGHYFIVGIIHDISQRKLTEEKLERLASVVTYAQEGIMITDASSNIIEVNESFSRITGYTAQEVLGQHPKILHAKRVTKESYETMWRTVQVEGHWRGEVWKRRKNGEIYPEMLTLSAVKNTEGQIKHYVSLFTDITAQKAHQAELEHIAHFDALTDLPNRLLLEDRLAQAVVQCQRRQRSLAVMYMDLDGFKVINDSHGHNVGDELLVNVSQRMKEALRESDTLARIGGDEFVALMVDIDTVQDCEIVLQRLLRAASDPVCIDRLSLQVSVSIGVTLYPDGSIDANQLIRRADQAMYVAKQSGKNRFHIFRANNSELARQ